MDTVVQALNVLYRQPDAAGKDKASAYLDDMQKSVVIRLQMLSFLLIVGITYYNHSELQMS